jgi:hypothetical protein
MGIERHHFGRPQVIAGLIGSAIVSITFAILSWTVWG